MFRNVIKIYQFDTYYPDHLMNEGEIVQEGNAEEIYLEPKSMFVSNFIGETNAISPSLLNNPPIIFLLSNGGIYKEHTTSFLLLFKKLLVEDEYPLTILVKDLYGLSIFEKF